MPGCCAFDTTCCQAQPHSNCWLLHFRTLPCYHSNADVEQQIGHLRAQLLRSEQDNELMRIKLEQETAEREKAQKQACALDGSCTTHAALRGHAHVVAQGRAWHVVTAATAHAAWCNSVTLSPACALPARYATGGNGKAHHVWAAGSTVRGAAAAPQQPQRDVVPWTLCLGPTSTRGCGLHVQA